MTAPSKVYFTTMRTGRRQSIPNKLQNLIQQAGIDQLDLEGKFVAIKLHVGEQGNVSFLRPQYARVLVEEVKRLGGIPFLTDCNTLYVGKRGSAPDHMLCAEMNGFTQLACGAPFIVADGIRGGDEVLLPIPQGSTGTILEEAHIGRAIADADVLIVLSHTKGCMASGFASTLKNLAMGCASRTGKAMQHNQGIAQVNEAMCIGCGRCIPNCGQDAIELKGDHAFVNDKCLGCGHCIIYCPVGAIRPKVHNSGLDLQYRLAEYASAVVASKPKQCFFVNIAIDITPGCDCFVDSDAPVVPNVGMFASFDPVAIDQAAADAVCAQPVNAGGALEDAQAAEEDAETISDHWTLLHPDAQWELQLEHAEALGTGTRAYELIEL